MSTALLTPRRQAAKNEAPPSPPLRAFAPWRAQPPLRPDEDPAFWRRLMRGFALVCRGAAGVFPGEAARAKANALFCRDHALRLEGRR